MPKKRNTYLVRLNKLYHYLENTDATITIEYEDDYGETIRKSYSRYEEINDLKQLFADGCEVSGTALRDITGDRSYEESNEIGKYANIDDSQKDVINGIFFTFKQDHQCQGVLSALAHTREDLYIKRRFDDYWFTNLRNVYPRIQYEIHERCVGYLNEFLHKDRLEYQPDRLGVDVKGNSPFNDLHRPLFLLSESEKSDVQQVINAYKKIQDPSFSIAPTLISEQIIPGYDSMARPCKKGGPNYEVPETIKLRQCLFADKNTWFDEHRYQKIHALKDRLFELNYDRWPRYAKALILVMNAEYAATKWWIVDLALQEVLHNVEFYLTYSTDAARGEQVTRFHLSAEQLTHLLEEYNFTIHPGEVFNVYGNSVLSQPVNRFSALMRANFIYEESEYLFFLRKKLVYHFYYEITKHLQFSDSNRHEFHRQMDIYLRKLIRFDHTCR